MDSEVERILKEALQLPESDRADLAGKLIDSLDDSMDEGDVTPHWAEEIDRRMRELDDGTVKGVPWDEVRRQLFESDDKPTK